MKSKLKNFQNYLDNIKIPILNNISFYKILQIYIDGIIKGSLGSRAAAASWNIFMSLFPFLMSTLLLMNYLPYYNELKGLTYNFLLKKLLPPNIFNIVNIYINNRESIFNDQLMTPNIFLLIFSLLLFIILSSSGVRSLINGFKSVNSKIKKTNSDLKIFIISILIVLFFSLFIFSSLFLIYTTEFIFEFIKSSLPFYTNEYKLIINIINFILSLSIFFIGICFLYYFGKTCKISFRGVMPGALLTTMLFTLTSYLFGYYISNFTKINVLYGSIGSVLIVMIWINLTVTFIFAGYELNMALKKAKENSKK